MSEVAPQSAREMATSRREFLRTAAVSAIAVPSALTHQSATQALEQTLPDTPVPRAEIAQAMFTIIQELPDRPVPECAQNVLETTSLKEAGLNDPLLAYITFQLSIQFHTDRISFDVLRKDAMTVGDLIRNIYTALNT